MFVYNSKFDDVSIIAYNISLKYKSRYAVEPKFHIINSGDLSLSHGCNPLHPESITDITDATESGRTIMPGLNQEWIRKARNFFMESPINFVTAIIWSLRKYQNRKYCTLLHVIELMPINHEWLFPVLRTEPEIEVLINTSETFVSCSKQPESSTISALLSGEFVGMVADNPMTKIDLKVFHFEIRNDHMKLKAEQDAYVSISKISNIIQEEIENNYLQIKEEVKVIVESEIEWTYDMPELAYLLVTGKSRQRIASINL